ncbi:MAG TPA: HNH endonuclease signature motif containing protein [Pseudonocardiaceae bacterium]|nr:HNH endonuclease signature motif containing protein [Pseudonocardiaceae bacterium]
MSTAPPRATRPSRTHSAKRHREGLSYALIGTVPPPTNTTPVPAHTKIRRHPQCPETAPHIGIPRAAQQLARDARIIPIVLGSRGEPLDVARTTRTLPAAIRRDAGCAFPGSSGPARWCDIHHIIHWYDNGPTSLNNCVALCGRHHRLLHHSHWRIQ